VWTKDLKIRTNLAQPQVTKILKALEARGLIKSIKSVANPSRKLVMLSELEPSKEVTGGAWWVAGG
jgi:DNA-directed RNA polymerase III subunit RPC6